MALNVEQIDKAMESFEKHQRDIEPAPGKPEKEPVAPVEPQAVKEEEQSKSPEPVEVPEDFLPEPPPEDADPSLREKHEQANRGISQKFTKLDAWRREKEAELAQKEAEFVARAAEVKEREDAAAMIEDAMVDALQANPEAFLKLPIAFILEKHPDGEKVRQKLAEVDSHKEATAKDAEHFGTRISELEQKLADTEITVLSQEIVSTLTDWGYTEDEVERFTNDPKNEAAIGDIRRQIDNGFNMKLILKNLGFDKRAYAPLESRRVSPAPDKPKEALTLKEKQEAGVLRFAELTRQGR